MGLEKGVTGRWGWRRVLIGRLLFVLHAVFGMAGRGRGPGDLHIRKV